ncbi:virion core protein, T7 gp14 family [Pseudovibrio ascidiaceicola]|uniref:virion core protein, T7 gp14 family n=1 Tax=Pseudovibrio ascidiaceicola TaxID=285279 RepID=UPI003D362E4D
MCPPAVLAAPMLLASLAVSTVTGVVGYIGQQNMAQAQVEAQEANNTALRQASISDMVQKGNDVNARQIEETAATGLRIQNEKIKAQQAKATANATSETAGISVDTLLADYDRQYLSYADSQMQQLGFNLDQIQRTREQISAQAQGRINTGWDNRPIEMPSFGMTLAGIAGSGLNSYNKYKQTT